MVANTTTGVWTEPFTPSDQIGQEVNEECVRCKDCGLTTLAGTESNVVHKRGCTHRGK